MEMAVARILVAERNFLDKHRNDAVFPVEAMIAELEPVFCENGWRQPLGEKPSILLMHSEANGDLVMSSALIREIRKKYPQSFITLMVPDYCMELARKCPYVDEVRIRPEQEEGVPWQKYVADMLKTLPELLERHYSLGFVWNEGRGAVDKLWLYFSGIRERVGFAPYYFEGADWISGAKPWYDMLTLAVPRDSKEAVCDSEKILRIAEALTGKMALERTVEVWTDEEDEKAALKILHELRVRGNCREVYAIMPGVSEARRRWPVERWAELTEIIMSREPKVGMVILGGSKEQELAQWLRYELNKKYRGRAVSAAGKLSFSGTAALLNRCRKYLGNDTGAVHLAVAQKVPVLVPYAYAIDLTLRTLSMPVRFAPWGVPAVQVFPREHRDDCHEINGPGCSRKNEAHCILGISVETMLYAYEALDMQIAKGAREPIRFC